MIGATFVNRCMWLSVCLCIAACGAPEDEATSVNLQEVTEATDEVIGTLEGVDDEATAKRAAKRIDSEIDDLKTQIETILEKPSLAEVLPLIAKANDIKDQIERIEQDVPQSKQYFQPLRDRLKQIEEDFQYP